MPWSAGGRGSNATRDFGGPTILVVDGSPSPGIEGGMPIMLPLRTAQTCANQHIERDQPWRQK